MFRSRNILGAAVVAGIGFGLYMGQWMGFGLGGSGSWGIGNPKGVPVSTGTPNNHDRDADPIDSPDTLKSDAPTAASTVVRVVIDDRKYLLRNEANESPITLENLIETIKNATGDKDGIRVRIYEKSTARMSTEEELKNALTAAEIPDAAVIWVPASPAN